MPGCGRWPDPVGHHTTGTVTAAEHFADAAAGDADTQPGAIATAAINVTPRLIPPPSLCPTWRT